MSRTEETSGPTRIIREGFEQLLAHHPDPAWIYDPQSLRLVQINDALASLTDFSPEDLLRMRLTDLLQPLGSDTRAPLITSEGPFEDSGEPLKSRWKIRTRNGRLLDLDASSHRMKLRGKTCRLVIARVRRDEGAKRPEAPSMMDALTGLPTGAAFLERIHTRSQQGRKAPGRRFAIVLADLDRFKLWSRSLGPDGANQLLAAVAKRLDSLMHPDEFVARLESERFALLLEDADNADAAVHAARSLQEGLETPFTIAGQEIRLTASVGIALGNDAQSADELIKNAEFALADAKSRGVGGNCAFAPEMRIRAAKDLRMEQDLRPGIESGDLRVCFQPIVAIRTGRLAGFEALVRWHHPELGLIMPNQFIPMAERTGIIVDLGKQVMQDACRQVCEWQSRFRADPPLFVTVNCSPAQFLDPKLATLVQWALASSGLSPKSLKLELTEGVLMESNPKVHRSLDRILSLGVHLIIDDFGTGYSSLSRLHQLPIEALKIDQSFVSGMIERQESQTMIRAIIQLARNFALKVTAEGVETADQLETLKRLDCDYAQGYYFAKALEPAAAEQLLSTNRRW